MLSNLMLGVVILCFGGGFALSFLKISQSPQRRIYWSLTCVAATASILSTYPTWERAAARASMPVLALIAAAYVATSHIKIGGKIYSLTIPDPHPEDVSTAESRAEPRRADLHPDSYSGLLTATTAWWLLLVPAVTATGNVYIFIIGEGELWVALMSATFLALLAVVAAYGDASWGYPIARGQYLQFVVITVITAGVFYFLYVAAYYAGQRHPLRRKQSMEYRAHPRHRELDN